MTSFAGNWGHWAGVVGSLATMACLLGGQSASRADDAIAFRNVRVFDGSKVTTGSTVVVEGGKIARIGADVEVPPGVSVIDGSDRTLLPGLIDAHTHTQNPSHLRQAAVFGVTTEFDMFTDVSFAARMRSGQTEGKADDRADLYSAGTLVTVPGGHGTQFGGNIPTIERPDQAAAFVDARIAEGSDYIKIIYDDGHEFGQSGPTVSRETLSAVIKAAHAKGKKAVVHIHAREFARFALAEGADGLVHLFIDEPIDEALVKLAVDSKAFVVPTFTIVMEAYNGRGSGVPLIDDPALSPFLTPTDANALRLAFPGLPQQKSAEIRAIPGRAALRLKRAGVPVLAGTDAPNPGTAHGVSIHRELELLVAAGLSPLEALEAATALPAKAFGLSDRGRIAPSLRADLVLVEGDPTTDIKATRRIVGVWKRGRPIDRDAYKATVLATVREAAKTTPTPPGSENGLVSDFEEGKVASAFGSGWMASTDSMVGGKSEVQFSVVSGGAGESKGSLQIAGKIDDRSQPRWAGAMFSPSNAPMAPANLSSKKAISFWVKGDGKPIAVMIFSEARGGRFPSMKTVEGGKEWTKHRFELKEFDGADGKGLMGVFFGGGAEVGPFEFRIDDVRFD